MHHNYASNEFRPIFLTMLPKYHNGLDESRTKSPWRKYPKGILSNWRGVYPLPISIPIYACVLFPEPRRKLSADAQSAHGYGSGIKYRYRKAACVVRSDCSAKTVKDSGQFSGCNKSAPDRNNSLETSMPVSLIKRCRIAEVSRRFAGLEALCIMHAHDQPNTSPDARSVLTVICMKALMILDVARQTR